MRFRFLLATNASCCGYPAARDVETPNADPPAGKREGSQGFKPSGIGRLGKLASRPRRQWMTRRAA
jgi:hypothetical protein